MNKRRVALASLLLISAIFIAGFEIAARMNALKTLRLIVKQAHLPVQINGATWNVSWAMLKKGMLSNLSFDGTAAGGIKFDVTTPVHFKKEGARWNISLEPRVLLTLGTPQLELPPFQGTINLIFSDDSLSARFNIKTSNGTLRIKGSENSVLEAQGVSLESKRFVWNGESLSLQVDLLVDSVQVLHGVSYLEKKGLKLSASGTLSKRNDSIRLELPTVVMSSPYKVTGHGVYENHQLSGALSLSVTAPDVLKDLPSIVPDFSAALLNAKAQGSVRLNTVVSKGVVSKIWGSADLTSIILPSKKFMAEKMRFNLQSNGDGAIDVLNARLGPVQTSKVHATVTIDSDNYDLRLPSGLTLQGIEPLGGVITVGPTRLTYKDKTLRGDSSLEGRDLKLSKIQTAFCLSPHQPLPGELRLQYSNISLERDLLRLTGTMQAPAFGGNFISEDILIELAEITRITMTNRLEDADLKVLAEWLGFGKVTGRLDAKAEKVQVALTRLGFMPTQYDIMIHGSSSPGKRLNFSAEALDNLMAMMGVKDAAANPVASVAFSAWRFFSSTFGFMNNMDYFGFHAKTQRAFTTLETFDPPGSKDHYLIHGTSFKMPMKSSDGEDSLYPIIMKTDNFQSWLWARIAWFQARNKEKTNEEHGKESCTPIWE